MKNTHLLKILSITVLATVLYGCSSSVNHPTYGEVKTDDQRYRTDRIACEKQAFQGPPSFNFTSPTGIGNQTTLQTLGVGDLKTERVSVSNYEQLMRYVSLENVLDTKPYLARLKKEGRDPYAATKTRDGINSYIDSCMKQKGWSRLQ